MPIGYFTNASDRFFQFLEEASETYNLGLGGARHFKIFQAVRKGKVAYVKKYFSNPNKDPNIRQNGKTLLHCAIRCNQPEVVKELLNNPKTDVNAYTTYSIAIERTITYTQTPLIQAITTNYNNRCNKIILLLLERTDIDFSLKDNYPLTARQHADTQEIRELLDQAEAKQARLKQYNSNSTSNLPPIVNNPQNNMTTRKKFISAKKHKKNKLPSLIGSTRYLINKTTEFLQDMWKSSKEELVSSWKYAKSKGTPGIVIFTLAAVGYGVASGVALSLTIKALPFVLIGSSLFIMVGSVILAFDLPDSPRKIKIKKTNQPNKKLAFSKKKRAVKSLNNNQRICHIYSEQAQFSNSPQLIFKSLTDEAGCQHFIEFNLADKPLHTSEHKIDSWHLSRVNTLLHNLSIFNFLSGSTRLIPINLVEREVVREDQLFEDEDSRSSSKEETELNDYLHPQAEDELIQDNSLTFKQ